MAVEIVRETSAPVGRVWSVLTDWPRHGAHVPLTRLTVTGPPGVGQEIDAATRLGPFAFHDVMRVDEWEPPTDGSAGHVVLTKIGRVLSGSARIEVAPHGSVARVAWAELVRPRPDLLGRAVGPLADVAARVLFGRTVDGLLREAAE
ncbi:hypothetical protein PZ938_09330 [Luteipulveratus sp. YIM 133132]|uniref:hypothetical protein n=1 Tax=Luteipulveratus flavus TaxID=3031728 RepID=UPI0023AEBDF6|nr:hypothetical protein [Luteipulveratus sp. YIM 133132]MDE9365802.1 hypothetical protein [Luteipulveratus sp. YIM 133132]